MGNGSDRGEGTSPSEAPADVLSHPVRRHIVTYLLNHASEGQELGMSMFVNEMARFKAYDPDGAPEKYQLGTVRTELEDHNLPRLGACHRMFLWHSHNT